jgi:hypothetical protein
MENSKKPIMCVGHSPCLDGFAAMWIVGHRFGFDNVEFVGVKYGDPVPDMTDRVVYIVDFSYPPHILIPAAATAKSIVVLDHHETAREQWTPVELEADVLAQLMKAYPESDGKFYNVGTGRLSFDTSDDADTIQTFIYPIPRNLDVVISNRHAGTVTTWDYLFPERQLDVPPILNAIDNGDRWVFGEFERTRDVCEYCRAHGFLRVDREKFDFFTKLIEGEEETPTWSDYMELADRGAEIAVAYDNLLLEFVPFDNPRLIEFMGYTVPCHAVPDFFKSSVGDRFGKMYPFSITYDDNLVPGHRKFSLRSDKETGINVEEIAKQFGGGGHVSAAGFTVPFSTALVDFKTSVEHMLTYHYQYLTGHPMPSTPTTSSQ